ncbi:MAG: SIR2 family protein [Planctomycetota bacterium]
MDLENSISDLLQQLDSLLNSTSQSWLFGAGTSFESGIPLMGALTKQVIATTTDDLHRQALQEIRDELDEACHIEHILSHIADCRAIAERCRSKEVSFGDTRLDLDTLDEFHRRLLSSIAKIVRWGYVESSGEEHPERIGTATNPIVAIRDQVAFVRAVFSHRQKNISERCHPVTLFTTNYDTLIEDALALECIPYWDGFEGGAVAFRSFRFRDNSPVAGIRAHVVKLHGSIDWHLSEDGRVWRIRDSDSYPEHNSRVLIYPQSTKYVATQRDPFASQFDLFRRTVGDREENLLGICGYSFGDDHINQEIQLAMDQDGNKTTILAFSSEINSVLAEWGERDWRKRLYVITENGIYVGGEGPFVKPPPDRKHDWWTLQGVTRLLQNGPEACI